MNRELVIDSNGTEVNIALLEDKTLVELNKEQNNNDFTVGDVFLGKVHKIMPGLNAAFVNVGYKKDAFLHYLDLGPQVLTMNNYVRLLIQGRGDKISYGKFKQEPDIEKTGKITKVLSPGQEILVQIAKEPISTKGPRISTEISFPGRYLVLLPFSDKISISQKIRGNEERGRLKRLIKSIRPENYGVIVRTVAENKKVAELDADLRDLVSKWEKISAKLPNLKAPQKVLSELDRTSAILRDLLNESFNSIYVNDPSLYEEIKSFISQIAPDKVDILKLYKGREAIFEQFNIEKQIRNSFGKNVTIKSGVYLIIEHTEALHVIDVNSGHRVNKDNSQEQNALATNMEAATEIARQLRLRDMGGIIVIDFIDMRDVRNRKTLFTHLVNEMAKDRAKHSILPPSKFGLIQITRQRVRPEMNVEVVEKCPVCNGTGQIKSSISVIDDIENNLEYLVRDQNESHLTLAVHPFIFAFLTQGFFSKRWKWYLEFKRWVKVKPMSNYQLLEYHFFDKNQDEIKQ
ncbi:MAG: Rne/Rng family ribonuclease [Bacteroidales bacterium]|nr:Rne/Rng family ribonuclease [Bacteroidales bacterium]